MGKACTNRLRSLAHRFIRDESGAVAIEYGLICGLIFLVIVGSINAVADSLYTNFWQPTAAAFN